MSRPHVCLIHVGGTIGMRRTPTGLVPQPGVLEHVLAGMTELEAEGVPSYDIHRLDPLLDSADMTPKDWFRIASAIAARDGQCDGFVIVHGTDTMVHTASALSFLLQGLSKPVILTGSQLSLEHPRTDGREHIITAIIMAGTLAIPEVCIYFGKHLLRGNRTQKIDSNDFVAFRSGNLAPLATAGVAITSHSALVRPPGAGLPATIVQKCHPQVVSLRVFPGITGAMLTQMLSPGVDGVVLETYGAGTFPARDRSLLEPIAQATGREPPAVIVNCSQCHGGIVRPSLYRGGRALASAGVLNGSDMTPEAALTKLYCLLALGHPPQHVRSSMEQDLAGELSSAS